jgi:ubiquinone/menaquinone biosynthesis C-methylase UbiE
MQTPTPHDHSADRFSSSRAFELNNPFKRLLDHTPQQFIKLLEIRPDWSVVDFGCGPGFFSIPFAKVATRVVAVDAQPEMLRKAESYARKSNVKVEFAESDGTSIPLSNDSFDLVFLNLVFHEISEKKRALSEFWRILKPGGKIAIREKQESTLLPGPPMIPYALLRLHLEDSRFIDVRNLGEKGKRIALGVKPRS